MGVTSLRVGRTPESAVEMLSFKDAGAPNLTPKEKKAQYIDAVLDTGTSCLILPSNDHGGVLADKPFQKFVKHFETRPDRSSAAAVQMENHDQEIEGSNVC